MIPTDSNDTLNQPIPTKTRDKGKVKENVNNSLQGKSTKQANNNLPLGFSNYEAWNEYIRKVIENISS